MQASVLQRYTCAEICTVMSRRSILETDVHERSLTLHLETFHDKDELGRKVARHPHSVKRSNHQAMSEQRDPEIVGGVLHHQKCRLYVLKGNAWDEQGCGDLQFRRIAYFVGARGKRVEKPSLLMEHNAPTPGYALRHPVHPQIELRAHGATRAGETGPRAWTWTVSDRATGAVTTFAAKFENTIAAEQFQEQYLKFREVARKESEQRRRRSPRKKSPRAKSSPRPKSHSTSSASSSSSNHSTSSSSPEKPVILTFASSSSEQTPPPPPPPPQGPEAPSRTPLGPPSALGDSLPPPRKRRDADAAFAGQLPAGSSPDKVPGPPPRKPNSSRERERSMVGDSRRSRGRNSSQQDKENIHKQSMPPKQAVPPILSNLAASFPCSQPCFSSAHHDLEVLAALPPHAADEDTLWFRSRVLGFLKDMLASERTMLKDTLAAMEEEAEVLGRLVQQADGANNKRRHTPQKWQGERDPAVLNVAALAALNAPLKQRHDGLKISNGQALQQLRFANKDVGGGSVVSTDTERSLAGSVVDRAESAVTSPSSGSDVSGPVLLSLGNQPRASLASVSHNNSEHAEEAGGAGAVHSSSANKDDAPNLVQFEIRKANKFRKDKTKLVSIDLVGRALLISRNLDPAGGGAAAAEGQHRLEKWAISLPERGARFDKELKIVFQTWEDLAAGAAKRAGAGSSQHSTRVSTVGPVGSSGKGDVLLKKDWKFSFNTSTERERFVGLLRCKVLYETGALRRTSTGQQRAERKSKDSKDNNRDNSKEENEAALQTALEDAANATGDDTASSYEPQRFVCTRAAEKLLDKLAVEAHAEALHQSWMLIQAQAGVKLGKAIDPGKNTHPHMKHWQQLDPSEQQLSIRL
eukprot:g35122.t1